MARICTDTDHGQQGSVYVVGLERHDWARLVALLGQKPRDGFDKLG